MNLFDYNYTLLTQNADVEYQIEQFSGTKYTYVISEGDVEWFLNRATNESYAVKDEIDDQQQLPNRLKRECIFVLGINSLKEIETLVGQLNPNSLLIIYEPSINILDHAMKTKDLEVLSRKNVILISCPLDRLSLKLKDVFSSKIVLEAGNTKIYITYFYRTYLTAATKEFLAILKLTLVTTLESFGNSVRDCLEGTVQTFQNLKHILHSKDVSKLKNAFSDKPAIIVSAGPSLEKNIQYLHQAQGKAIIIATETILSRLLQEGIIPNFVTTIERIQAAYEYGYKGKNIPPEVTLIAPGVIKPAIFDEYPGDIIIPMRDGVREYKWWRSVLELDTDSFVTMGDSTAHLAFGFAMHIGANPIVLIGQDLAFGDLGTKCHASGTLYEETGSNPNKNPLLEPTEQVPGYYGEMVTTSPLWLSFKKWFELYTYTLKDKITVINATEGGAKIANTVQMPFAEVIQHYCIEPVEVADIIHNCPVYTIDRDKTAKKIRKEMDYFKELAKKANRMQRKLSKIKLSSDFSQQQLYIVYNELKNLKIADELLHKTYNNDMLFHNMQPEIVHTFQKLYRIEEVLNYQNLHTNLEIQHTFAATFLLVLNEVLPAMEQTYEQLVQGLEEQA